MSSLLKNYPQTHIQTIGPLLFQMHDLGFSGQELEQVERVYHLVLQCWAVNYQSSSRPFVCHAVGTASVVAANGGDMDTILAALLHAAYSTGDFGVRIAGATRRKRQKVREVAGIKTELLVYRFYELLVQYGLHWKNALEEVSVNNNTDTDRAVLLIRICNDLDDISDMPFCSEARKKRMVSYSRGSVQLAEFIGRPDLSNELTEQYQSYRDVSFLPTSIYQ